ncbi:hypothetical protein ACGGZK_05770 [Agromyces sp. MMS24-K17]|uniref:hypothetical protein n=1 Tax=Agromyces sp. MMS24-K17 TaxID=3372850 RepID=UPI0037547008
MRDLAGYDAFTDRLVTAFGADPDAQGLVLLGSTAAADRRDRWSDHDVFAIVREGCGAAARARLGWLPDAERIVLVAREGRIGFSVLYDDGHLVEFALSTLDELAGAGVDAHEVAFGDAGVREFVAEAHARSAAAPASVDAVNEAGLAFVKLLVGFGRARRGERIVAGQFVRGYAVTHLLHAARARLDPPGGGSRDPLDPARRFDADHPAFAARLDRALDGPVELAALEVARLVRETLEPGWPDFPAAAAEAAIAILAEADAEGDAVGPPGGDPVVGPTRVDALASASDRSTRTAG